MNNKRLGVFSGSSWVLVIIIILALGCGRFGGSPSGGIGDKVKNLTIPTIDPNEPFPALTTDAFDALSTEVPELAKHREAVLAAERDAIKGALDDLRSKSKAANKTMGDSIPESAGFCMPTREPLAWTDVENANVMGAGNDDRTAALFDGPFNLIPVAMAAEPDMSSLGFIQQMLIGHQIGLIMADTGDAKTGTGSKTVSMKDEKTGEVQASVTLSVDKDGGPMTMELTTKISMPVFGLDAGSKVSFTGNPCPNADGKVDITVKGASNGRAGRAGSFFYDKNLETKITATVGEDANVAGADFDVKQNTHSSGSGQQVDFITSQSVHMTGNSYSNLKFDDQKIDRGSQFVSPADQKASDDGLTNAFYLAIGALESAKERWQSGGCVKIEANSPGTVAPNSTTAIPVTVRHKFGGSEVPSKLDAVLSGGQAIDPATLARTAGTLTYTAPGETGKSATIALTATSKRGKATLDLTANTGGASYQIKGGLDAWQTDMPVCDIMKPFTLTGGGFTMQLSGGLAGTYTYSGPFNARGAGTYTISLPDGMGKPGTMIGGGPGTITGDKVYSGKGTEHYTLTPIPPCSQ